MISENKTRFPQTIRLINAGIFIGIIGSIFGMLQYGLFFDKNLYRLWWIVMFASYFVLYVVSFIGLNKKKDWAWKVIVIVFSICLASAIYGSVRMFFFWEKISETAIAFRLVNLCYAGVLFVLAFLPKTKQYLIGQNEKNT